MLQKLLKKRLLLPLGYPHNVVNSNYFFVRTKKNFAYKLY